MSLNNPISQKTMVPNSAEFHVAKRWSDILLSMGVYKDPDIQPAGETVEDVYANWKGKKIKDGDKYTVKLTLHEQRTDILSIIEKGIVEYKQEVATVTARTEQRSPGEWSFDDDVLLEKANADGSAITPTKVEALISGTWQLLVTATDYSVGVTSFGKTYVKLISGSKLAEDAPSKVVIKVTYDATPDATVTYAVHSRTAMPQGFVMVVDWSWDYEGEKVGIRMHLENCTSKKGALKPISDDDATTSGYEVEMTGTIIKHEFINMA